VGGVLSGVRKARHVRPEPETRGQAHAPCRAEQSFRRMRWRQRTEEGSSFGDQLTTTPTSTTSTTYTPMTGHSATFTRHTDADVAVAAVAAGTFSAGGHVHSSRRLHKSRNTPGR
jgi:hypothetical protein